MCGGTEPSWVFPVHDSGLSPRVRGIFFGVSGLKENEGLSPRVQGLATKCYRRGKRPRKTFFHRAKHATLSQDFRLSFNAGTPRHSNTFKQVNGSERTVCTRSMRPSSEEPSQPKVPQPKSFLHKSFLPGPLLELGLV